MDIELKIVLGVGMKTDLQDYMAEYFNMMRLSKNEYKN